MEDKTEIKAIILSTLSAFTLTTAASAATFDTGSLSFQYYAYGSQYDGLGSPASFNTPGGTEFGDYFAVAASGNQITYTYLSDVTWSASQASLDVNGLYIENGSLLASITGIPSFTSVTIDPSSQLGGSGFNASDVTFTSGDIAVTWANQAFAAGDTVVLDVNSSSGAVPEPATWALMLLGFGMVGFAMRKRSNVRTTVKFA